MSLSSTPKETNAKKNLTEIMHNENLSDSFRSSVGYRMAFLMFLLFSTAFTAKSIYVLFPTNFEVLNILVCLTLTVVYFLVLINTLPIILNKKLSMTKSKNTKNFTMTKNKSMNNLATH